MQKDLTNDVVIHQEKDGIQYLQFKKLLEYEDQLAHCFSTRIGGVGGHLNLRFSENEVKDHIVSNYKKICDVIGVNHKDLVFAKQVHEDVIRIVGEENRGEGIIKPGPKDGCDGLITNFSKVPLVTLYADCVPVIFYDPVKKIIAMSHAGWRGTVKKIPAKTIARMHEQYKCNLDNIIACIGPSIGSCCFEVDEPVVNEFKHAFGFWPEIIEPSSLEKSRINLWKANSLQLIEAGLKEENVQVSEICTTCNTDIFYSYRAEQGKTGRLAAFMQIND